jgi:hypothetical protein
MKPFLLLLICMYIKWILEPVLTYAYLHCDSGESVYIILYSDYITDW